MMDREKIEKLRKQYPAQYYSILEQNGKLTVSRKVKAVRLYAGLLEKDSSPKRLSEAIGKALEKAEGSSFQQVQRQIYLDTYERLCEKARALKTKKFSLLAALLGKGD